MAIVLAKQLMDISDHTWWAIGILRLHNTLLCLEVVWSGKG